MGSPAAVPVSRSLLLVTLRRASITSRFYLVYGTAVSIILGVLLAHFSPGSFVTTYPLFVPIFGVVGSMGGLIVFTSDRTKGVLEYLIAYGYSPRKLFANVLLTTLVLVAVLVGISSSLSVGVYLAKGNPVTDTLLVSLVLYAVPMSFACAAFASTVGVYWTTLSSPRYGINSPIGLIPFLGIIPSLITLFVIESVSHSGPLATSTLLLILGSAMGCVALVVIVLLVGMGKLLRTERFLSPA
jgi:hypothetical protein